MAEREQFLSDIISTAIEGGIGYWSTTLAYQWTDDDGQPQLCVGERLARPTGTYAAITPVDSEVIYGIDTNIIAKGIDVMRESPNFNGSHVLRDSILAASRENDAGDIDADCADVIVQAALFGELVYG